MCPLCPVTRIGELSFSRAVHACLCIAVRVFVWAIVIIEERSGGGSRSLTGRFLEFTVKGFVPTATLEVACEEYDDC